MPSNKNLAGGDVIQTMLPRSPPLVLYKGFDGRGGDLCWRPGAVCGRECSVNPATLSSISIAAIKISDSCEGAPHDTLWAESKGSSEGSAQFRGDSCPTNCVISWHSRTTNWKN